MGGKQQTTDRIRRRTEAAPEGKFPRVGFTSQNTNSELMTRNYTNNTSKLATTEHKTIDVPPICVRAVSCFSHIYRYIITYRVGKQYHICLYAHLYACRKAHSQKREETRKKPARKQHRLHPKLKLPLFLYSYLALPISTRRTLTGTRSRALFATLSASRQQEAPIFHVPCAAVPLSNPVLTTSGDLIRAAPT